MKTLDRYILRQFIINYAILGVVLMLLFVMVDLIVDLDEFMEAANAWADRNDSNTVFGAGAVVIDYYGPMAALLYVFFAGLLAVGAMGFVFAGLSRTGELVAMVTGGVSMHRLAAPIIVAGGIFAALALPVQELALPQLAHKLIRSKSELKREAPKSRPIFFVPDSDGNLFSAARVNSDRTLMEGVTILERDEAGLMTRRISADQATWDKTAHAWRLDNGRELDRTLSGAFGSTMANRLSETVGPSGGAFGDTGMDAGRPVDLFATDLSPDVLLALHGRFYPRFLDLNELRVLRSNEALDQPSRERLTRIMHTRLSTVVISVLVLIMGLPFFMLREPGSLLLASTKAAGVCLTAWAVGMLLIESNLPMVGPVTAAWLPVVLYLPLSLWMLVSIKT